MVEKQVLVTLLSREGWERLGVIISSDFFESSSNAVIFEIIRGFWNEVPDSVIRFSRKSLISYISTMYGGKVNEIARLVRTVNSLPNKEEDLGPLVKKVILSWKGRDILTRAEECLINNTLDPLSVSQEFEDLSRIEVQDSTALDVRDEIGEILSLSSNVIPISTGISGLDSLLGGGILPGEMGLVLAPTGEQGGKTWFLTNLGVAALMKGHPVLGVTLELAKRSFVIRFMQNLLKRTRYSILRERKEVEEQFEKLELPPFRVLDYSSNGVSTGQLLQECLEWKKSIPRELPSPLFIVDHLELGTIFPHNKSLEGRFALNDIAVQLRQIAVKTGGAIWTAQQANRPALNANHIRLEHAAEGLGPSRKSDLVVSINCNFEEQELGIRRIVVLKARERALEGHTVVVKANKETQSFVDVED